ncbi:MAG: WhiB family transcriptional regulator [Candidatus Nanopelagicales bacterium]
MAAGTSSGLSAFAAQFSTTTVHPTDHATSPITNQQGKEDETMQTFVDANPQRTNPPDDVLWEDVAACRVVPEAANLFFSEDIGEIAAAKRICADCPVLAECLQGALERQEPWGVWGGQLFMHGKMLTTKRRRGRPPRITRPEDHMPTIPIPVHLRKKAQRVSA